MEYNKDVFYHDIIESMVTALEARDTYTAGHSLRVSDMTNKLCELLNLDNENKQIIHIASHLHDIGKIGVKDSVLNKEGPLNDIEWELLKKHSEIGYNILIKSEFLKDIANIVLCHHERWDGNGYPNKLKNEEIPYGARIIALCDSIDAMKSNRPYRKGLSDGICKEEIRKNIRVMYDPKMAKCVLNNWDDIIIGYNGYEELVIATSK
ncbi:HD domain-containing protein [Clostridium gasigenes]|uniref:HD-GYP domain-containing protein n=1 Tax=Clostridium gasigenes TaxID=94869 RepID=UPI001C0B4B0F|nr:HD domain-containing phosphohydrolase [Clostridium gasigenes]MBU3133708.1 HD domain-containing protein [Clostridium gasigenes]